MKTKYAFLLLLLPFFIASCSDNDRPEPNPGQSEWEDVNKWIYEEMTEWYLWYDEIPDDSKLDGTKDAETFFSTLLSKKDGKDYDGEYGTAHYYYSYIKENTAGSKSYLGDGLSLGMEYQTYYDRSHNYSMQVLYVLKDSPAAEAGILRGDWIVRINNRDISDESIAALTNGSSVTLGISDEFYGEVKKTAQLSARSVYDNPVYLAEVIPYNNQKFGYLMYNHFNPDPTRTDDGEFNDSLKEAFQSFKAAEINDLILDMRYNGGGYISCAQLLAAMIVPSANLSDTFCQLTYNDKKTKQNSSAKFRQGVQAYNLNLNTLYVLTSRLTASSSELVIAGLKPYMKVVIIGDTTEGKNVGSDVKKNDDYDWELHPILCRVTNINELDYSDGFDPDVEFVFESDDELGVLGDYRSEPLLKITLDYITTGAIPPVQNKTKALESGLTAGSSSLDRKKTNGVILQ